MLLEKRYEQSPLTLALCLTQVMHICLGASLSTEHLALRISGNPKKNSLGKVLFYHESGDTPIDIPSPQNKVNLIPLIHVLLFFNETIDDDDDYSAVSSNDPSLDSGIYGYDSVKKLAQSKGLLISNESYTGQDNMVGIDLVPPS